MPNSQPPSGSHKGWLLAIGEDKQKSAAKSSSASKQYSVSMCFFVAKASGVAHSGASSNKI